MAVVERGVIVKFCVFCEGVDRTPAQVRKVVGSVTFRHGIYIHESQIAEKITISS